MRAPLRAVWPPLFLLFATIAAFAVSLAIWWPLGLALVPAMAIFALDARARGRDFRYALAHLQRGRAPERIAAIFRMSWCMRVACQTAADSVGRETGEAVRESNRAEGYRWYHFMPDATFTRQSPFLNLLFWRITLMGYDEGRRRPATLPKVVVSNRKAGRAPSAGSRARQAA